MHFELLGQAAHQHVADARRSAAKPQVARTASDARTATDDRGTIRSRAGWTLVQIGLRLATRSADA
jgi:hypothetical protein